MVPRDGRKEKMGEKEKRNPVRLARSNTAPYTKYCNCYSHPGFRVKFNLKRLCLLTKITTKFKKASFNVFRRLC